MRFDKKRETKKKLKKKYDFFTTFKNRLIKELYDLNKNPG